MPKNPEGFLRWWWCRPIHVLDLDLVGLATVLYRTVGTGRSHVDLDLHVCSAETHSVYMCTLLPSITVTYMYAQTLRM